MRRDCPQEQRWQPASQQHETRLSTGTEVTTSLTTTWDETVHRNRGDNQPHNNMRRDCPQEQRWQPASQQHETRLSTGTEVTTSLTTTNLEDNTTTWQHQTLYSYKRLVNMPASTIIYVHSGCSLVTCRLCEDLQWESAETCTDGEKSLPVRTPVRWQDVH